MKTHRYGTLLPTLLLAIVLVGCASLGEPFKPTADVPAGKALVYLYRPAGFVGGGVSYMVNAGKTPVTKLPAGGYYPYLTAPGEIEFWAETESRSSVTVDARAGQVHYVKGTIGVGFFVGRPHLTLPDAAVAQKELLECKLIPDEPAPKPVAK